jgi:Protein of unknown function (DUF2490)
MKVLKISFYILLIASANNLFAQNTRINDVNNIGWYNLFLNKKIAEKWTGNAEYQWRRDNVILDNKQSLLRVGIGYQIQPLVVLRAGYAWVETYAYGSIPIQSAGKTFTEHRTFQSVIVNDNVSILEIQNRFMLEQRWIGRYSNAELLKEDEYIFINRIRYMLRIQMPIGKKKIEDKTLYAAAYDEIFIQFGKNVQENIFDQNRLGILLGYRFGKNFRLEMGALSQTVQFGREIFGSNVLQYNNGLIVNTFVTF